MITNAISADATMSATKIFAFPRRDNAGGWDKLIELGARLTGVGNLQFREAEVPQGWEIRESGISIFQKQLFDADGKMIAKIFYKPTGGGGSLHVFLTEDDPMAHPAVVAAFGSQRGAENADALGPHSSRVPLEDRKSNACPVGRQDACAPRAARINLFHFPSRSNDGGLEKLIELGASVSTADPSVSGSTLLNVPNDWEWRESGVSPWQKRIFDGQGNLLALFFFKPCGGSTSIHVFLSDEDPMRPVN